MLINQPEISGVPPPAVLHPWYAIRTKSNQERVATVSLANKGYECYLPSYTDRSRRSDRISILERPLFPGYLFCRFDVRLRMPIIKTPGIISILGFGSEPLALAENEIKAIQTLLGSGLPAKPCPFLQKGQRIQVTSGCMKGLEGILVEQKSTWRLVISVTILQRSVSVEIDRDIVSVV